METMMGYIEESAAQCRRNIEQASQLVQPAVDLYTKKEYNRILIIASGSSYNGSCLAKYFVEKVLKVRTEVVTSFTFNHYETIFDEKTFVFGAGQSGRSTNTNDALQKARDHGLTGNVESVMKEHCDLCLNWGMVIDSCFVQENPTAPWIRRSSTRSNFIIRLSLLVFYKPTSLPVFGALEPMMSFIRFRASSSGLTHLSRPIAEITWNGMTLNRTLKCSSR